MDFICIINDGVIITTDKLAKASDLKIIGKCIKNVNNINSDIIKSSWLPKSKLYLKIIGLSYIGENGTTTITSNIIKGILKKMHIFNNIVLVSKPHIIKALPKSNIAVVWVDIWDS